MVFTEHSSDFLAPLPILREWLGSGGLQDDAGRDRKVGTTRTGFEFVTGYVLPNWSTAPVSRTDRNISDSTSSPDDSEDWSRPLVDANAIVISASI
jgi:hypothetical protein